MRSAEPVYRYRAYGVRLRTNRPLPGVTPAPEGAAEDVRIDFVERRLDEMPVRLEADWVVSPIRKAHPLVGHQVWTFRTNGHLYYRLRLRYVFDGFFGDFIIDQAGRRIWAAWGDGVTFHDIVASLLGPILGSVLRLRGITCLHGSVAAIGEQAFALMGPKLSGKSTVVAALSRDGVSVLSDDITVLREDGERFMVEPGYHRLRLKPSAIQALYGAPDGLVPVRSFDTKRYLELVPDTDASRWRFETKPLPLAALYVLSTRDGEIPAPLMRPLCGAEALKTVLANSYVDYMVTPALRASEFPRLGRLVAKVPVREIRRPDTLAALPQICALIKDDLRRLG